MERDLTCYGVTPTMWPLASRTVLVVRASCLDQYILLNKGRDVEVQPHKQLEDGGTRAPVDEPGLRVEAQQRSMYNI